MTRRRPRPQQPPGEPQAGDADGGRPRDGRRRTLAALLLFGSPLYLEPMGPLILLGLPAAAYLLGPRTWPGDSPRRSLALGAIVSLALLAAVLAVIPYQGTCRPSGALAEVVAPLAALIVYLAGCVIAARGRRGAWPLGVLLAGGAFDLVSQIGEWTGAQTVCGSR